MERFDEARRLVEGGCYGEALALCEAALAAAYEDADAHWLRGLIALQRGELDAAIAHCQQALTHAEGHRLALLTAGAAHLSRGERMSATAYYGRYQGLEPDSPLAYYFMRLLGHRDFSAPLAGEVLDLFQGYAESFDAHLLEELDYVGHRRLAEFVQRAMPGGRLAHLLDLGCGTGLCGRLLRDNATLLSGVDLAPAMVAEARRLGGYDVLYAAEAVFALCTYRDGSLDAIVAADVFGYVGDLTALLAECRRVLAPQGFVAFSVEASAGDDGFVMTPKRRVAFGARYLRQLAGQVGFAHCDLEAAALRSERGEPVPGYLVMLR